MTKLNLAEIEARANAANSLLEKKYPKMMSWRGVVIR